jgi:hypothetical protein
LEVHLCKGLRILKQVKQYILRILFAEIENVISTLKMKAAYYSATLVCKHGTTRRCNPGDRNMKRAANVGKELHTKICACLYQPVKESLDNPAKIKSINARHVQNRTTALPRGHTVNLLWELNAHLRIKKSDINSTKMKYI